MISKRSKTGYGVFDITRQIARRVKLEWEAVESTPRPPMRFSPETQSAEIIEFPLRYAPAKRPLAA
jgi:hypothetical protein